MSKLENEYYFLYPEFTPGMVMLQPDEMTSARPYLSSELPAGKPLHFFNGFADRVGSGGAAERIDDLLYGGKTFAFRDRLRERLECFDIAGLQFYPMIFTDTAGNDHLDYWFANVYEEQPFLHVGRSELVPGSEPGEGWIALLRFAFNAPAMRKVPVEQRLIFRPSGVLNAVLAFHQKAVDILNAEGATGFKAFRVSEFREGMQY